MSFFTKTLCKQKAAWCCLLCVLFCLLAVEPVTALGGKPSLLPVGMRSFGVWEPESGQRFDFSVWHPAESAAGETERDGWVVAAGKQSRPLPGAYPVILLSHDTAGSRYAHSDLAAALAAQGMMVVVPTHAGDCQNDSSGVYSARMLYERPRQLLRALDTLLGTPEFAPYVDESRIGLVGIGFGAVTALQLAGARPAMDVLSFYCDGVEGVFSARRDEEDAFCAPWTRGRLERAEEGMSRLMESAGAYAFTPPVDLYAPELIQVSLWPDELDEDTSTEVPVPSVPEVEENSPASYFRTLPLLGGRTPQTPFADFSLEGSPLFAAREVQRGHAPEFREPAPEQRVYRRPAERRAIRAVALVSPAGGMLFSGKELAAVNLPVAVVEAGQNILYPPLTHARPYVTMLPVRPALLSLEEADHFSLFSPCTKDSLVTLGETCGRLPADERREAASRRDAFLLSFFSSALGGPLSPAAPSGYIALPVAE